MNYKDAIQEYADEIAWESYDKDFYDLPEDKQDKVYEQAQERYIDNFASQIDGMKEREKYINAPGGEKNGTSRESAQRRE